MLENIKKIIPEMDKKDSLGFYNKAIKQKGTKKVILPTKLAISFVSILLIAVIIPLSIELLDLTEVTDTPSGIGDINPGKNKDIVAEYFDTFFAFGSGTPSSLFSANMLLNSNILNEEDKSIIRQSKNGINSFFNVYFGVKDDVDIVVLSQLNDPYAVLVFESNFEYSFIDCINEFQQMCGEEITQDYLISSKFDNDLRKEVNGIIVCLELVNKKYQVYYTLDFNNNSYQLVK